MTIETIEFYRYRLPLTKALSLGDDLVSERQGLLVHLTLDSGAEGWGDVAPLPGFSVETVDEAIADARRLRDGWEGQMLTDGSLETALRGLSVPDGVAASVRFGGESAVVEALAEAQSISPARLLGADRSIVTLNALVRTEEAGALVEVGRQLRGAGYYAVKLKVGRAEVPVDVERVRALRRGLGEDVELRLDANRAWSFDEAVSFLSEIREIPFAYIEEPLSDPEWLPKLVDATGCSVAIDETTRERSVDVLREWPVRAVILKPTLLGGLQTAWDWGMAASQHGVRPVVSASYESGVGTRMLAALAASLSDAPAGLSPYTRLAVDVLTPRLSMDGPTVDLSTFSRSTVCVARLGSPLD